MSESARPGAGDPAGDTGPGGRRWVVLVAGLLAMTAGCTFQYGLAYLIPAFRAEGLSLEQAGILVACPTAGLLLTLVAWGAAADRWGERLVLGAGLALAGTILLAGTTVHGTAALGACLAAAGAAGASVYAASGRLIPGWFDQRRIPVVEVSSEMVEQDQRYLAPARVAVGVLDTIRPADQLVRQFCVRGRQGTSFHGEAADTCDGSGHGPDRTVPVSAWVTQPATIAAIRFWVSGIQSSCGYRTAAPRQKVSVWMMRTARGGMLVRDAVRHGRLGEQR